MRARQHIAVYAARAWCVSTYLTTHKWPLTCPPLTMDTVQMGALKASILYLRLHGIKGQPYLYGDPGWLTALSLEQVMAADFSGSLVFLEGCYGVEFAKAFLDAGARSVVGCDQPTWGRRYRLGPSSIVGQRWLRGLRSGLPVWEALEIALKDVASEYCRGWKVIGEKGALYV